MRDTHTYLAVRLLKLYFKNLLNIRRIVLFSYSIRENNIINGIQKWQECVGERERSILYTYYYYIRKEIFISSAKEDFLFCNITSNGQTRRISANFLPTTGVQ